MNKDCELRGDEHWQKTKTYTNEQKKHRLQQNNAYNWALNCENTATTNIIHDEWQKLVCPIVCSKTKTFTQQKRSYIFSLQLLRWHFADGDFFTSN